MKLTEILLKQVVAAIMVREDRVLICQRREDQPFALQWEFPGGKVEPGEDFPTALVRELQEELGIDAVVGREIATVQHQYAEGWGVELHFLLVPEYLGEIDNKIFREVRWEMLEVLNVDSFLQADQGVVRSLKNREWGI